MSASIWTPGTTTTQSSPAIAQFVFVAGSAGAPGISFSGDLDSGFFQPYVGGVSLSINGSTRLTVDDGSVTWDNVYVSLLNTSGNSIGAAYSAAVGDTTLSIIGTLIGGQGGSSGGASGLYIGGGIDAEIGFPAYSLRVAKTITKAASSTHSEFVAGIFSLVVAAGAATLTRAATLKLTAPTGVAATNNFTLWTDSGRILFGGGTTPTQNAFNASGVTINQSAADDEILTFKSSDVAHGMTSIAETDTYGTFVKYDGNQGGLWITAYSEAISGLVLSGVSTTADTTKNSGARAPIEIRAFKKNGTTSQSMTTTENMLVVAGATGNAFIFDASSVFTCYNSNYTDKFGDGLVRLASNVAIAAGGTSGKGFAFSSTANFGVFFGSGAPTISAAKGSLYLRSDGSSTTTRAYINTDGGTTWTAITTVA
jgi:hypothetical protein